MYSDNLIIKDEKTGDSVIFNSRTFYEIVKGIIINYAKKSEKEAENLMADFFKGKYPPVTYNDAVWYTHELEYHWAMLIAYGEGYWRSQNVSPEPPDNYKEWETNYIKKNNLEDFSYDFQE